MHLHVVLQPRIVIRRDGRNVLLFAEVVVGDLKDVSIIDTPIIEVALVVVPQNVGIIEVKADIGRIIRETMQEVITIHA